MENSKIIRSINPATLEEVGQARIVKTDALPEILKKSRKAQEEWSNWTQKDKKKCLKLLKIYLRDNLEGLAYIIASETGKPRIEAVNSDIFPAISVVEYCRQKIKKIHDRKKFPRNKLNFFLKFAGRESYIHPRPLGIIGIISPWNFPFGIPFTQTVMAITAGNAVVLKPSSETPLTGLEIAKAFKETGIPEFLVQALPGSGSGIGAALVKSDVNRIIFTGSVDIGKHIMQQAAQTLTPVTMELGGKDPMIILEDAHLDRAIKGAVWASFINSGQVCVGVKRIYVHEEIYDEFIQKFKTQVEALKQGWGWDNPDIDVGSLINESALLEMEEHVRRAQEQGAKILTGGERNGDLAGYFFKPTVLYDMEQDHDSVQEEIFGPITNVLQFQTDKEAVTLANDSRFALSGSVWTSNIKRGKNIAEQLLGGTITINNHCYTYALPETPWGGRRESGFGRTHGEFGFDELLEPHHIHVDKAKFSSDPWWHPYTRAKFEITQDLVDATFYGKIFRFIKVWRHLKKDP